jgi:hypothetical protein
MGQARVYLPEDTPKRDRLEELGFRWCKKDRRFEKAGRMKSEILSKLTNLLEPSCRITEWHNAQEVQLAPFNGGDVNSTIP